MTTYNHVIPVHRHGNLFHYKTKIIGANQIMTKLLARTHESHTHLKGHHP